jgi:hypothetical protein
MSSFNIPNPDFYVVVTLVTGNSRKLSDAEQTQISELLKADEHVLDVDGTHERAVSFRLALGFDKTLGSEIRRLKRLVGGPWVKDAHVDRNPQKPAYIQAIAEANERPPQVRSGSKEVEIPFKTYRC